MIPQDMLIRLQKAAAYHLHLEVNSIGMLGVLTNGLCEILIEAKITKKLRAPDLKEGDILTISMPVYRDPYPLPPGCCAYPYDTLQRTKFLEIFADRTEAGYLEPVIYSVNWMES